MEQTNVIIPTDAELKNSFSNFCDEAGMSVATAINIFMKKTVRENRIPFEITGEIPNEETIEAINEAKRIMEHPEQYKGYTNINEMMRDLLS